MSDYSDLLIGAGYIRHTETFGLISARDRPDAESVERFGDQLVETLEMDPEALILEFVRQEMRSRADMFLVVAWWDGDLSAVERDTLSVAYRNEFLWSGGVAPVAGPQA